AALARKAGIGDADQTADAVFFVGGELHRLCSLAIGIMSSMPSASLAASDMRALVHGGSKTSSSLTPVTPGTARTARSTSPGSVPATGQLGAVSVMRIATLPSASTAQS